MKIIIGHRIRKREFRKGIISERDLEHIMRGYKRRIITPIKGEGLPKGSRLEKIYVTTEYGAQRLVFLTEVASEDGFFLCYRNKNDRVGENISIHNPYFRVLLKKYLLLLKEDIRDGTFDLY